MNLQDISWDAIIPIGDACRTTIILKQANLRKKAFPLDWVVSFADTTYLDITTNFSYLLNKDKSKYSHYQNFDKTEINKILQNRVDRFYHYLNSNLNLIFFYSTWSRVSTIRTELIKQQDQKHLVKIIDYINQLSSIKSKKIILTNVNDTLNDLKDVENVELININININDVDIFNPIQVSNYNENIRPRLEEYFTKICVKNLSDLQFTHFTDNINEVSPDIYVTDW